MITLSGTFDLLREDWNGQAADQRGQQERCVVQVRGALAMEACAFSVGLQQTQDKCMDTRLVGRTKRNVSRPRLWSFRGVE